MEVLARGSTACTGTAFQADMRPGSSAPRAGPRSTVIMTQTKPTMSTSLALITCSWATRIVCVHRIRFAIAHGDVNLILAVFASPIPGWGVQALEGVRGARVVHLDRCRALAGIILCKRSRAREVGLETLVLVQVECSQRGRLAFCQAQGLRNQFPVSGHQFEPHRGPGWGVHHLEHTSSARMHPHRDAVRIDRRPWAHWWRRRWRWWRRGGWRGWWW